MSSVARTRPSFSENVETSARAGAVTVLGSATPSLETLSLARRQKLVELRLPDRATRAALPRVETVDLRRFRNGPTGERLLSLPLHRALGECLERGEWVGVLADRSLHEGVRHHTDFLGQRASFALAPFRMAAMLKYEVVFMVALYPVIETAFGRKHFRLIGVVILFFPAATIAWMVYDTTGASSPYYAGLILVMMFLAVLLDWTFWQSVAAVVLVWVLYLAACFAIDRPFEAGVFLNNAFFLISTGVVTIISAKYHTDIRMREFVSQRELEKANAKIKEEQLKNIQAEKMAALGRYSAGLMHDILNQINIASQGCYGMRKAGRHLAEEHTATFNQKVTATEDGLNRIKKIVESLKMFSHPGNQPREMVNLAEHINVALQVVSDRLENLNIMVQQDVNPEQSVLVNAAEFNQVLVNLLVNAVDALEEKKFPAGSGPIIRITSSEENGRSLIFVRDNGMGIPPEKQAQIFDPFVTTKDIGKGTGLGLSICFGIMNSYGGTINVRSEPGRYAEFMLVIPLQANDKDNL